MWAPMMEKVWGKIKGSYYQTDGGFVTNGLRSVTGAPTIRYEFTNAWTSYTTPKTPEKWKSDKCNR